MCNNLELRDQKENRNRFIMKKKNVFPPKCLREKKINSKKKSKYYN